MFEYVYFRHSRRLSLTFDTLEDALEDAWNDLEFEGAWPFEIKRDGVVLWTNEGGNPLKDGTCELNDRLYQYADEHGLG